MSTTGTLNRIRDTKGFTLIELIVVMILVGLIFSIAAPRFRDAVLTDNLKSSARRLIGLIDNLRNEAIQKHTDQIIFFNVESNKYWYGPADMTAEGRDSYKKKNTNTLPKDVLITEIWTPGKDKKILGEPTIRLYKNGYAQQAAIRLEEKGGDREFTLLIRPFLPEVKTMEKHVDYESSSIW